MESSHQRDHSKAYSEEIDAPDQVDDDDTGTGRPYECMFCRRGFSSAQALGGHMNIHRRDRARIRQPPRPEEEASEGCDYIQRHQNYRPAVYPPAYDPLRGPYGVYFPGGSSSISSTSAARPTAQGRGVAQWERRRELRMFGGDLHLGLGASGDDKREDGQRRQSEEDGGLDLELRLGMDGDQVSLPAMESVHVAFLQQGHRRGSTYFG
ncbi:hypothetical protein Taro_009860 [Colocasia esculenta]|uniref:C2H2-type domain-containing protein n=1 Tax=Colocasia esculenta TaxID=4460 RepID=A0A843U665_COLES|nr:hypothetical protein [Colocasia esculenta]